MMKHIFTLLMLTLLLLSCSKDNEKDGREDTPVTTKEIQQQMDSEPESVSEPAPDVLIYSVQIGAFTKANADFESISGVKVYQEGGLTKYRLGSFDAYREARRFRSQLLDNYPDAFVQALKNDTPLNIRSALAEFN